MLEFWEEHDKKDGGCKGCWTGFPCICANCGSLIHAEFGDEDYDGDYWLNYECENCGDDYEFMEE